MQIVVSNIKWVDISVRRDYFSWPLTHSFKEIFDTSSDIRNLQQGATKWSFWLDKINSKVILSSNSFCFASCSSQEYLSNWDKVFSFLSSLDSDRLTLLIKKRDLQTTLQRETQDKVKHAVNGNTIWLILVW